MNELSQHYRTLLGLNDSWSVDEVDLNLGASRVLIRLSHVGGKLECPECGDACSRADTAPERRWRHLDTMQFQTEIAASIPRCRCAKCGVKTIAIPWADKHSRFTWMFEVMAIRVLQAAANVQRAADLLQLSWDRTHSIIKRAVKRGLERRKLEEVRYVGIDEKSFGKGQDYISLMTDLGVHRVLEVVPGRTIESCDGLWETLEEDQKTKILAVSMDMWQAFMSSTEKNVPDAEIVHDKFHVSKYLNEAVDKVRRKENKKLLSDGDEQLKGTRQMWLFNEENLDEERLAKLETAIGRDLQTGVAWSIKENFRDFWDYILSTTAEKFFQRWYAWAQSSELGPIKKVADMLNRHLDGLLSYFRYSITNAVTEGFNSRIQSIKSAARGFRCFENYRARILFYCGKLDLMPNRRH